MNITNISDLVEILRRLSVECHCQWKEELEFALSDAADTIESLSAKLADMERPAEDYGEWIPCSTGKMPEGGRAVLIRLRRGCGGIDGIGDNDNGSYDISFLRTDKNEWVSSCDTYPPEDVVAWKPIKPYRLSCYLPEENNPYPLCIGRGLDMCKDCGLWRDLMPSWIDDGKNW